MTRPKARVRCCRSLSFALLPVVLAAATAKADINVQAAGGELVMVSDSDCPSVEAIRQALVGFLPVAEWPAFSVKIRTTLQMLVVEIGPQEKIPRQVAVGPDCAARATAVALMISTWTGDLPVEAVGTPILQPTVSVPQPADFQLQPAAAPVPPPALPSRAVIPQGRDRQREIGAGLLASTAGAMVPGGRVELGRMRRDSGLGWQLDLTVPAARDVQVGEGTTRWMRFSTGVALAARWAMRSLVFDSELGVVAGLTYAWGRGYAVNQSDWSPTWGLAAGIRAGLPWGRTRLWLDLRAVKWLREQNVKIDPRTTGTATTLGLPSWDAQGAVGISYLFQ